MIDIRLDFHDPPVQHSWAEQVRLHVPRCHACNHHPNNHVASGCNVMIDKSRCGCSHIRKQK